MEKLTTQQKKFLLELARNSILSHLKNDNFNIDKKLIKLFKESHGVFITLTKDNQLRGCIGNIESQVSLLEEIHRNAIAAASEDPRFSPINKNELKNINIEISILSKPEKSDVEYIKKNIDGVVLKYDPYQATFLPQVWKKINEKTKFLESLSQKAGLHKDAYLDKKTELFTYQVEAFSEADFK